MSIQVDLQHGRAYCVEWKIPNVQGEDLLIRKHLEFRGGELLSIGGEMDVINLFLDHATLEVHFIAQRYLTDVDKVAARTAHRG